MSRAAIWVLWALALPAHAATVWEPLARISAEERYDDDLLLRTSDRRLLTGQLMSKLSPEVGLSAEDHTFRCKARYALDLSLRHGSGTTSADHRGTLEFNQSLSPLTTVQANLGIWRVSDPVSLPRLGLARELSPVVYGKGEVGLKLTFSERSILRTGYRFEAERRLTGTRFAGSSHGPFAEGWWMAGPRLTVGLEGRWQFFSHAEQGASAPGLFAATRLRLSRLTTVSAWAGPSVYLSPEAKGWVPRLAFEWARTGKQVDLAVVVGHDLVGASGLSSAVWAQFASVVSAVRLSEPLRLYAVASYFKNGRAPGEGLGTLWPLARGPSGFAAEVRAEYRASARLSLSATVHRVTQVGDEALALSRNILGVRLVWTPVGE